MAFITKNVSITLLLFIVASLAFLIGSTVYYQVHLQNVNQKYESQIESLSKLEKKATNTTEELNKAVRERELRLARGSKFELTYSQLKSQQETSEALRDRSRQEKADLEQSLAASQKEYIESKNQENQFERENQQLQIQGHQRLEEKARKENTLRSLKNQLDQLQAQLESLKK